MTLTCSQCSNCYSADRARWRCECGSYLRLRDTGMFQLTALASRQHTLWRYREALGLEPGTPAVSLGEGWTPLQASGFGGREFLFKLDYLCSTGSYKDRGAAVMISQLKHWGVKHIIEDSSGNAGAAVAAYAAKAGLSCDIYIPAATSGGKAAQIEMYGGNLCRISGSREQTTEAAVAAAANGAFYASHNWSPYFVAGMKTIAFEIAEQMSHGSFHNALGPNGTPVWEAPDWVVVPVGGGGLLTGVFQGFRDLWSAGLATRMPKLLAVQAAACAPVERAWSGGLNHVPAVEKGHTAAEGISIAQPVRGEDVLEAIRESRGSVSTVEDDQIWRAFDGLARSGFYVEPTSAAAPAAALAAAERGLIARDERVVVVLTGIGLKATDKILQHLSAGHDEAAATASTEAALHS